ncbi:MAG TPA: DUF58 domain-containing protein [Spirochaetia bacterium]|nr:DUF58 domain-containing protein [Spirochaetia bacterium]
MKNQLFATVLLLSIVVFIGLITISGTLLVVGAPLLVYLLAGWLGRPAPPRLRVERRISPERANPDDPIRVEVLVENQGAHLPEIVVEDRLPAGIRLTDGSPRQIASLPAGAELSFEYTVTGSRGSYDFRTVEVAIAGALPLRAHNFTYPVEHELIMLPNHRALARIPIAPRRTLVYAGTNPARQGGEGTEFFDIREHRGSESLRRVNWRASARHPDALFVNEFQQERVADVAILLDCRMRAYPHPHARKLFDASASAAASLVDVILDASNRVGYLGYGLSLDWLSPGFGRVQKHRVLNRIARTSLGESHVFSKLDALPERLFPPGSQVILVSPLTEDDPPALERLQSFGYAVMVVSPNPVPLQTPAELDPVMRESARLLRLQRTVLLRRLRHVGVAVIDWDTDESLESAVGMSLGSILAAWRRRRR